jgi:hypothetical protein
MAQQLNQTAYGSGVESGLGNETMPEGAELRKIYVDTKKPLDASFEKYGHLFYNVYIQNARNKWVPGGLKYWEQNGEFRKILAKSTPVYPFEQLEEDLKIVIHEHLKDSGFRIIDKYYSHNGFTGYWTLISDLRQIVRGSYVRDDIVEIGIAIRNGIATGVALGADFFTNRLICQNGAVGRGDNFGSISIRHVGDQKSMIELFKQKIPEVIKIGQGIVKYYEMATGLRFNEAMAKRIYKKTGIAQKYFPEYFGVDPDQKDVDKQVNITEQARNLTVWEVFNDLTKPLTESLRSSQKIHLGFSSFSEQTRKLHRELVNIVDDNRGVVAA